MSLKSIRSLLFFMVACFQQGMWPDKTPVTEIVTRSQPWEGHALWPFWEALKQFLSLRHNHIYKYIILYIHIMKWMLLRKLPVSLHNSNYWGLHRRTQGLRWPHHLAFVTSPGTADGTWHSRLCRPGFDQFLAIWEPRVLHSGLHEGRNWGVKKSHK